MENTLQILQYVLNEFGIEYEEVNLNRSDNKKVGIKSNYSVSDIESRIDKLLSDEDYHHKVNCLIMLKNWLTSSAKQVIENDGIIIY